MEVDTENEMLVFSTGTRLSANCCIVGLGVVDVGVYGGSDDVLLSPRWQPPISEAECMEMADYMILRWQQFRAQHGGK